MIEPIAKVFAQKIFVSVEVNRVPGNIEHTLVVHNQSEFTIELLSVKTSPKIPLGFGQSMSIDDAKMFQNKTLIPGQKTTTTIDHKAIKDKKQIHSISVTYKTHVPFKESPVGTQKSNTFEYQLSAYTVPIRAINNMKY